MHIQTTFRLSIAEINELRIGFQGVQQNWVYFTLELNTGILKDLSSWPPNDVIPNWYTDNPFQKWVIECSLGQCVYNGKNCEFSQPTRLAELLKPITNQIVCAVWTGKYGFSISNHS